MHYANEWHPIPIFHFIHIHGPPGLKSPTQAAVRCRMRSYEAYDNEIIIATD